MSSSFFVNVDGYLVGASRSSWRGGRAAKRPSEREQSKAER